MATYTVSVGLASVGFPMWSGDGLGTYVSASSSSTRFVFSNADGTFTFLNGTGLVRDGLGYISWTTLGSAQHIASNGSTLIKQITGFNPAVTNDSNGHFFTILDSDDTVTGSSGGDNLNAHNGTNTFLAGAGSDFVFGGTGTDTYRIQAGDWVPVNRADGNAPHDFFEAGNGTDTVQLENAGNVGFFTDGAGQSTIQGAEIIRFFSGTSIVTISGAVLHGVSSFTGSAGVDTIIVSSATAQGGGDFSGLTFTSWTAGQDTITFNSNSFVGLTGTSQDDIFNLTGNGDVRGGQGNDTFVVSSATGTATLIDGGGGTDTIKLDSANFSLGPTTLTAVEQLVFNSGSSTMTVNGGGTTNPLAGVPSVVGSVNIDHLVFTN